MPAFAGLILLFVLLMVFVAAVLRTNRLKARYARWAAYAVACLAIPAVTAALALVSAGLIRAHAPGAAQAPSLKVAVTADRVERGFEITESFCSDCHSPHENARLTGGVDLGAHLGTPLGSFVSANLTPAGALSHWTDGEIFRAIRHGVSADGHKLFLMSLTNAAHLSDDDIQAVIAYLRSMPAAGSPTPEPPDHFTALGAALYGLMALKHPETPVEGVVTAPERGATAQFGGYIVSYNDCALCHGPDLSGGVPGQLPPIGPDLALVRQWTLDQFIATFHTGVDPNGHKIEGRMPWKEIGTMKDDDLAALYAYLIQATGKSGAPNS